MIQLLFTVILSQISLTLILLFETPLRKTLLLGLDCLKRGTRPLVVKTLAATVSLILLTSLYSVISVYQRFYDDGILNPTDQVFLAQHMLKSTFMGGALFLALIIDRLHHYIRELLLRRKAVEDAENQAQIKALEEETVSLTRKLKELKFELKAKTKEIDAAKASKVALRKQSDGLFLEYDRLLAENENLRNHLRSMDWKWSHSGSKKNL